MTTQQQIDYHTQAISILEDIKRTEYKIKRKEESLRGYPGIEIPGTLRHDIEISKAVITRLNTRLDRLKFKFDM